MSFDSSISILFQDDNSIEHALSNPNRFRHWQQIIEQYSIYPKRVKEIIDSHASMDADEYLVFRLASRYGQLSLLQYLWQHYSIDPEAKNHDALREAIIHRHPKVVAFLVRQVKVSIAWENYRPLIYAIETGQIGLTHFFLDHGADVSVQKQWPLRTSIVYGRFSIFRDLLRRGGDPHVGNNYPYQLSAHTGRLSFLKYLDQVYGHFTVSDRDNRPILMACHQNHTTIIKYLMEQNNLKPSILNHYPIWMACYHGNITLLQYFCQSSLTREAFECIIRQGHLYVLEWIYATHPEMVPNDFASDSHYIQLAVRYDYRIVSFLAEHGFSVDALHNYHMISLVQDGQVELVRVLLDRGVPMERRFLETMFPDFLSRPFAEVENRFHQNLCPVCLDGFDQTNVVQFPCCHLIHVGCFHNLVQKVCPFHCSE